jgi:hypothetical protein
MFHKATTVAERQKLFDEYLLGLLKQKKVKKTNKKIIDESGSSYDPELEKNQIKGAFNNYVDTLVVKNFMIEQLQSRFKKSKSLSANFVNKLYGNQVLILSKNLNEFDNLQKDYSITLQKEKVNEVIKDNQIETGQVLQDNIPAEELQPTPSPSKQLEEEEHKFISFLNKTVFKIKGRRDFTATTIKKILLSEYLTEKPDLFASSRTGAALRW